MEVSTACEQNVLAIRPLYDLLLRGRASRLPLPEARCLATARQLAQVLVEDGAHSRVEGGIALGRLLAIKGKSRLDREG